MISNVRTVKVFFTTEFQLNNLTCQHELVESYDAFVVINVKAESEEELQKSLQELNAEFPVEDITDHYQLQLETSKINTALPRITPDGTVQRHPDYPTYKLDSNQPHHYIVQFIGPVKKNWLDDVKRVGAQPREPIGSFSYIVRCDPKRLISVLKMPFVRWVGHLPHPDRLFVPEVPAPGALAQVYSIDFFDRHDRNAASEAVSKVGVEIIGNDPSGSLMVVRVPDDRLDILKALSAVHGVKTVRQRVRKRKANNIATELMSIASLESGSMNLSGEGETIAICDSGLDTGDIDAIHPDFAGRVVGIRSYPVNPGNDEDIVNLGSDDGGADTTDGHGTHVAGSALGSGSASLIDANGARPLRGLAHKAQLYFQAVEQTIERRSLKESSEHIDGETGMVGFPNDLRDLFADAMNNGASIHSNSWGGWELAKYDPEAKQVDDFVYYNEHFCILLAAGNEGEDEDCDGVVTRGTVNPPGTAKNCITVGATESNRPDFDLPTYGSRYPGRFSCAQYQSKPLANAPDQVAGFSSRGPVQGDRVKPDIVAPGTFILSTRSQAMNMEPAEAGLAGFNDDYFYMCGTSMATPLVAGAVAVLREYIRKYQPAINNPTAALVKACLIGGATRLPSYGVEGAPFDNDQGYGLISVDAIIAPDPPAATYFVDQTNGLETGKIHTREFILNNSQVPLRIALAYSDYPGPSLVNNINIMLIRPDGRQLAGNADEDNPLAFDRINNTEVIEIKNPDEGRWQLCVIADGVHPEKPQNYALYFSGAISVPEYVDSAPAGG